MFNNQAYSWDQLVPSSPTLVAGSSGSSNFSNSPTWASSSLAASSPSPSGGYAMLPPPVEALAIDYNALIGIHLPLLDQAFPHNGIERQTLPLIVNRVHQGLLPEDALLNNMVIQGTDWHHCSVRSCPRHTQPYSRLDRAREHFRTEHLGAYFPCSWPGCFKRFRRVSDLRAHVHRHNGDAPIYVCNHCDTTFPNRSNLNRHLEAIHHMVAPRRRRGT